ncbi:MAG: glycosyltransferase [Desulfamplus sp.]|nr:glycosyltransferase [Desulfamplus sp.]
MTKTSLSHASQDGISAQVQQIITNHVHETCSSELFKTPLVSVVIFTFNDIKFIRESIESVIAQKTDFPYEIIIGDDCSTDGTTDILREYQSLYPERFRLLIADRNLWNPLPGIKGLTPLAALQSPRGKFIAFQHGDDYWTDHSKLQKQVDFLEANPQFSMCSHEVEIMFEGVEKVDSFYGKPIVCASFDQLIMSPMFIALNSILYRRECLPEIPTWALKLPGMHKCLILLISSKGYNFHFFEKMGVKRRNSGGITYTHKEWREKNKSNYQIYLFENLKRHLNGSKDHIINQKLLKLYTRKLTTELKAANLFEISYSAIQIVKILHTQLRLHSSSSGS